MQTIEWNAMDHHEKSGKIMGPATELGYYTNSGSTWPTTPTNEKTIESHSVKENFRYTKQKQNG